MALNRRSFLRFLGVASVAPMAFIGVGKAKAAFLPSPCPYEKEWQLHEKVMLREARGYYVGNGKTQHIPLGFMPDYLVITK